MKRYHQYPLQMRITVLSITVFCCWTFYVWTFSPHATAQRVQRQHLDIESQVNGLNASYAQLAGQCFAFIGERDSLLNIVNWGAIRAWQTRDAAQTIFLSNTNIKSLDGT